MVAGPEARMEGRCFEHGAAGAGRVGQVGDPTPLMVAGPGKVRSVKAPAAPALPEELTAVLRRMRLPYVARR